MSDNTILLAFFGHHKCASTWIHSILAAFSWEAGLRHAYLHNERQFHGDLARHIDANRIDLISYVNADREQIAPLGDLRGFHVIRDPRDLIVSAYFSHLHSHPTDDWPELEEHRAHLRELPEREGLKLEMGFSASVLEQIRSWDYERPDVLELRQEEITRSPYLGFLEIFDSLGILDTQDGNWTARSRQLAREGWNAVAHRSALPAKRIDRFPAERLLGIVHEHRFAKLAGGRDHGREDTTSHYRRGVAGDWRNHFDDELVAIFKDRFGGIVHELGYEEDAEW